MLGLCGSVFGCSCARTQHGRAVQVFDQLRDDSLRAIARKLLDETTERAATLGLRLTFADSTLALLCAQGFSIDSGARELRRSVTALIEDPLTDFVLARGGGDAAAGAHIVVEAHGGVVTLREWGAQDEAAAAAARAAEAARRAEEARPRGHPVYTSQGEPWDFVVEEATIIRRNAEVVEV